MLAYRLHQHRAAELHRQAEEARRGRLAQRRPPRSATGSGGDTRGRYAPAA